MVSMGDWCRKNKMRIATGKTQCALMKGTLERDPAIHLNGENITRKRINRYLGIQIDEKINTLRRFVQGQLL